MATTSSPIKLSSFLYKETRGGRESPGVEGERGRDGWSPPTTAEFTVPGSGPRPACEAPRGPAATQSACLTLEPLILPYACVTCGSIFTVTPGSWLGLCGFPDAPRPQTPSPARGFEDVFTLKSFTGKVYGSVVTGFCLFSSVCLRPGDAKSWCHTCTRVCSRTRS